MLRKKRNRKLEQLATSPSTALKGREPQSLTAIIRERFFEHRFAVGGVAFILLLAVSSLVAPWIGQVLGVNPERQNIAARYSPTVSMVELSGDEQEEALENWINTNPETADRVVRTLKKENLVEPGIAEEDVLFEAWGMLTDPDSQKRLEKLTDPDVKQWMQLKKGFKTTHYLGTDEIGRDVLIRLIYGGRISLLVGFIVALAAALIGMLVGGIAGYYGGWIDALLMRVTDSLLALPVLPILILLAAVDLKKVPILGLFVQGNNESIAKIVIIISLFSWMTAARIVRSGVLSVKEKEFVLAAKTMGASDLRILVVHILPNAFAPLLVAITLMAGDAVLFEAALSFLGLGIQPPTPSWGNMLFNAQELIYESPSLAIFPGLLIFLLVISLNFIGDGLQDAIDPKSRR